MVFCMDLVVIQGRNQFHCGHVPQLDVTHPNRNEAISVGRDSKMEYQVARCRNLRCGGALWRYVPEHHLTAGSDEPLASREECDLIPVSLQRFPGNPLTGLQVPDEQSVVPE